MALSDGKPIAAGMRVTIGADSTQDSQTSLLQPDGSFEFTGLPAGKYLVFASVRGYRPPKWDYNSKQERPGTVQVAGGVDDFVLTLDPVK